MTKIKTIKKEKIDEESNKNVFETKRFLLLILAILLIIGTIIFLNDKKAESTNETIIQEITVNNTHSLKKDELFPKAKELVSPNGYINVKNITIAEQIGKKVVLVDFWTYSCINCQRTTPYLNSWNEKYKDAGLMIIGVHTPEFAFEKEYANVLYATQKFGITYPVIQDNEYKTWRAYKNQYWPRKYLIDIDGYIAYDHVGEGGYVDTEEEIQKLLQERKEILNLNISIPTGIVNPSVTPMQFGDIGTNEIYFGYAFSRDQLGNKEGLQPEKIVSYKIPQETEKNMFYLEGDWKNNGDNMELVSTEGTIKLTYYAKKLYMVASSNSEKPVNIYTTVDEKFEINTTIQHSELYTLANNTPAFHTAIIKAKKGLKTYTFTFG